MPLHFSFMHFLNVVTADKKYGTSRPSQISGPLVVTICIGKLLAGVGGWVGGAATRREVLTSGYIT